MTTILIFFLTLALLTSPSQVKAEERSFLEISPAIIEIILENPEEEKEIELELKNTSDQTLSLELFAIDFRQQDLTNSIEFLPIGQKDYSYSLVSFLTLATNQLTLGPNEEKKVVVTVKNRDDLSPGGHYAAIVAKLISESEKQGLTKVSPALSSMIFLRKTGGERFNLSLKRINWAPKLVTFRYPDTLQLMFQNEGNIHIIPYGGIGVHDIFKRALFDGIINTASSPILPQSRKYLEVKLKKNRSSLPISFNFLNIQGRDSLDKINFVYRNSFLYVNPVFLIILLIAVPSLLFWQKFKKRKKK